MSNVVTHPNAPTKNTSAEAPKPKLLDEVRARIPRLNYSISTKDAYVDWVRRFVLFHDERHPHGMARARTQEYQGLLDARFGGHDGYAEYP